MYNHGGQIPAYGNERKSALDKLPSRIRYYLLDWKDKNMEQYESIAGGKRLIHLNIDELHHLYSYAVTKDSVLILQEKEVGNG